MARKLSNWLSHYAEYTEGTESPPTFHLWVALSTIAGAAQRKIYLDLDYYEVHTNMYVVLVSPPGRSRKSTALRIGKGILKGVTNYGQELYFSTQATSVAALVKQMSAIKTKEHQSLTAFSSELGSLLGTKSSEMTDFLTDIYDCNPDWDKQTVGRGLEKIERPWLNIVAATTPTWMGDNLSSTATDGGFVRRIVFVFDDTRLLVAFPELSAEQKIIQKALVHDLAHIAGLRGRFRITPEAKQYYTDWYVNPGRLITTEARLTGFLEVEHIHVLKVAMAISLSYKDELMLETRDIIAAIEMLQELKPGMRRAFSAVGKNIFSTDMERMKTQIFESGTKGMSYRQLFNNNIHALQKEEFDRLLVAIAETGDVVRRKDGVFLATYLFNGGQNGRSRTSSLQPGSEGSDPAGSADE